MIVYEDMRTVMGINDLKPPCKKNPSGIVLGFGLDSCNGLYSLVSGGFWSDPSDRSGLPLPPSLAIVRIKLCSAE